MNHRKFLVKFLTKMLLKFDTEAFEHEIDQKKKEYERAMIMEKLIQENSKIKDKKELQEHIERTLFGRP